MFHPVCVAISSCNFDRFRDTAPLKCASLSPLKAEWSSTYFFCLTETLLKTVGIKFCSNCLAGCSNEGQFAFTVESIVMAQKLRGTLTYVIKVPFSNSSFCPLSPPPSPWGTLTYVIRVPFTNSSFSPFHAPGGHYLLRGTLTYVIKVPFTSSSFSPFHLPPCYIDHFELALETV